MRKVLGGGIIGHIGINRTLAILKSIFLAKDVGDVQGIVVRYAILVNSTFPPPVPEYSWRISVEGCLHGFHSWFTSYTER